jgi:murein DD-endopeptidase MepM/ murein hydrolase activator NlpD
MKKILYFIIDVLILLSTTSCQIDKSNIIKVPSQTPTPVTIIIPNHNLYPGVGVNTNAPIYPTNNKVITATITETRIVRKTPTQTEIPFIMCPPLQGETIPSLWEIITNPFGSPPVGREDLHHGVDFAYYRRRDRLSIEGEIIQSILPGTVAAAIQNRLPYGNMVIVETPQTMLPIELREKYNLVPGESLYSLYAHMGESPSVELDEIVYCGQEVGTVGLSGYDIVNAHLHLETRIGPSNSRFTGMAFYDTGASPEEMDNYKRWRTSGDFRNVDPMLIFAGYLSYLNPEFLTPTP